MGKKVFLGEIDSYQSMPINLPYNVSASDMLKADVSVVPNASDSNYALPSPANMVDVMPIELPKVDGGSVQKADVAPMDYPSPSPKTQEELNAEEEYDVDDDGDSTKFKLGLPLILVGGAILFYFLRKKKK